MRFAAVAAAFVLFASVASAQTHSTGLTLTKTCDSTPVPQGGTVNCTFTITNSGDPDHGVELDSITNTVPCNTPIDAGAGTCGPGSGAAAAVQCLQGGSPVSVLGPSTNLATRSCSGTIAEVVPVSCNPSDEQVVDLVYASGTDADPGTFANLPIANGATGVANVIGQSCDVEEFCRTPGFWGSHGEADPEKACSQNITLAALCWVDGVAGCQGGEAIEVCGECISNTIVPDNLAQGNASSAIEALCVRVKGDERLQLVRQLTAARLNCIVSGETGGACDGISINSIFDACNTACAADDLTIMVGADEVSCVDALDCFNNGGVFTPSTGECTFPFGCSDDLSPCTPGVTDCGVGEECLPLPSCHSTEFPDDFLPNDFLPSDNACFEKQGPAGSSDECKRAHKNDCTVIPPGESECTVDSDACLP